MPKPNDMPAFPRSCKTLYERILVQMSKLIRLCEQEGYNPQTLNPSRAIVKEMRRSMNVRRIVDGMVEYNHPAKAREEGDNG